MFSEKQIKEMIDETAVSSIKGKDINPKDIEVSGAAKIFEDIVDKDGHKRFVEGELDEETPVKSGALYKKWSLSGTHLMIVFSGVIPAGTSFSNYETLFKCSLPTWIMNKIYPVRSGYIELAKTFNGITESYGSKTIQLSMAKEDKLNVSFYGSHSFAEKTYYRIVFDLLIDNE